MHRGGQPTLSNTWDVHVLCTAFLEGHPLAVVLVRDPDPLGRMSLLLVAFTKVAPMHVAGGSIYCSLSGSESPCFPQVGDEAVAARTNASLDRRSDET